MLLLSMVYSIEYRRDNDEVKLKSLAEINRQWSYQIDTLDSLSRQSDNNENKQKSQAGKSEAEKIVDYQRLIKKCYFANSYIYGSSMPMIEYLLTGYCDDLQRLQNFGFIDLKIPISELQGIFDAAISKYYNVQFVDGLDAYYYQSNDVSTPEYEALVNKVRDINAHNNQKNLRAEFETIVADINSSVNLKKYQFILICLFENIGAEQFFDLFITYRNSRKRDYWNFFDERYNSKDCFDLDREFIDNLRDRLNQYLSDTSIEASGTRKYCSKIQELLNKKVQQFGGHVE